eukprot:Skav215121  [mRNA]  locus=scaffold1893:366641:367366:- [translate_table: standard]
MPTSAELQELRRCVGQMRERLDDSTVQIDAMRCVNSLLKSEDARQAAVNLDYMELVATAMRNYFSDDVQKEGSLSLGYLVRGSPERRLKATALEAVGLLVVAMRFADSRDPQDPIHLSIISCALGWLCVGSHETALARQKQAVGLGAFECVTRLHCELSRTDILQSHERTAVKPRTAFALGCLCFGHSAEQRRRQAVEMGAAPMVEQFQKIIRDSGTASTAAVSEISSVVDLLNPNQAWRF